MATAGVLLALGSPGVAAEEADLDPLVARIVEMLEAGVEADLAEAWLARQGPCTGNMGPDELIALARARAPRSLVDRLTARLCEQSPDAGHTGRSVASSAAELASTTDMSFHFEYRPVVVPGQPAWDLMVYLDGEILAWLPGDRGLLARHDLEFTRSIPVGQHHLRLLLERHSATSAAGRSWPHWARACPTVIDFETVPGEGWALRVEVKESRFRRNRGPVSWYLLRDGRVQAEVVETASRLEQWPEVCEEIEDGLRGGREPSRSQRQRLERCVRWASLWPETVAAPSRGEIRQRLARYRYRPVPIEAR